MYTLKDNYDVYCFKYDDTKRICDLYLEMTENICLEVWILEAQRWGVQW